MTDGLPTDEQLRRIERGVQRRIRARRLVAQRVVGASAAVLLVVGGIALVRPVLPVGSASSGGSAGGSSGAASSSREVAVVCHVGGGTEKVTAARDGLPASAFAACAAALPAGASSRPTSGAPPIPVLCRAPSGALHVYLGAPGTCAEHEMRGVDG